MTKGMEDMKKRLLYLTLGTLLLLNMTGCTSANI